MSLAKSHRTMPTTVWIYPTCCHTFGKSPTNARDFQKIPTNSKRFHYNLENSNFPGGQSLIGDFSYFYNTWQTECLQTIREEKGLKREDVAKKLGTSGAIIGRYERNERTPNIDIAKNIAEALDVSLDYLVGDTTVLLKDKKMLYRLEVLQKIKPDYKERILYMLDLMLKDAQNNSLQEKLA
jgi:transcriptional regulator with XRE-family HTH domain